jgi:hypothetical protein
MTPLEMSAIRPIDIIDQAHFDRLLAAIPQPVTEDWRAQYQRLNAIARRHGFVWPYRIRMAERRIVLARPTTPTPPQRHTVQPPPPLAGLTQPGPKGRGETLVVPHTRSAQHICNHDGYEYFFADTYLCRAPLTNPIDQDEVCREGREFVCSYTEADATLLALTGMGVNIHP